MIILDTNIVSELMRTDPDPRVVAWVDDQPVSDLVISSITAAELRAGVALQPAGRKRARISDQVEALIEDTFADAVLAFDAASSRYYAQIVSKRSRAGSPIAAMDAQIAAICEQHEATLATRNRRDFLDTGVDLIDPYAYQS